MVPYTSISKFSASLASNQYNIINSDTWNLIVGQTMAKKLLHIYAGFVNFTAKNAELLPISFANFCTRAHPRPSMIRILNFLRWRVTSDVTWTNTGEQMTHPAPPDPLRPQLRCMSTLILAPTTWRVYIWTLFHVFIFSFSPLPSLSDISSLSPEEQQ
jgi:hypothetical protein